MRKDFFVLEKMYEELCTMQDDAGLIYTAAYDPGAWVQIGDHTIYWPAHTIHDKPSLFDRRGVVKFTMRNGASVAISPKSLPLQIVLCGLLLVLQLVAGEKGTCDLLTKHHRCNESFDFTAICKQIKKKIPTIDLAFDAIEEEVKRRSGPRVE